MGMFDKPAFLTGENGYVQPGETLWLHNARMDGTANVNGTERPKCKLLVSRERDGEQTVVFTSGAGIVGQVSRMTPDDVRGFPRELRLDAIPSGKGNPTNVLTPVEQDAPAGVGGDDDIPF